MPVSIAQCPLCQGNRSGFCSFAPVRGWNYVSCSECSLVFLDPQPTGEELSQFYNHSYKYDRSRYRELVQKQRQWLELLNAQHVQPGKLLEVGCSYGYFLASARDQGWNVQGIELGEEAAQFARSEHDLYVTTTRLQDADAQLVSPVDAIVAWHMLEHDPCPRGFVTAAFRLLRPGGILALRVPNLDSTVARFAGPDWQWLSPPEHVCMYTAPTLSMLLKDSAFEIVETQTVKGNARNMWFEIARARTKSLIADVAARRDGGGQSSNFSPPTVYENRRWYRAAEVAVTFATLPIDLLLSRRIAMRGRESELVVVARKPNAQ